MQKKYDLIIVGGGAAGCSAAYNAAKKGLSVLLLEKSNSLGGQMSSGLVTPMMNNSENTLNTDFLNLFLSEMKKNNAAITFKDGNKGWFNPLISKFILDDLLSFKNLDIFFNIELVKVEKSENKISGVHFQHFGLLEYVEADYFIDATGDAIFSFLAGCDMVNDTTQKQAASLRFSMSNVDLKSFADFILNLGEEDDITSIFIDGSKVHLSTAYTNNSTKKWPLKAIFEEALADGVVFEDDISYFQVFTIEGMPNTITFNCPRISNFDDVFDIKAYSNGLKHGRKQILRLVNFSKSYLKGFEAAFLSCISEIMGIRESRRVKTKYIFTKDDIINPKEFKHPILETKYPIDIHKPNSQKDTTLTTPKEKYSLPLESLISYNFDNLFIIGRCLGASFEAQASLRIIPNCMSMGEGLIKYLF